MEKEVLYLYFSQGGITTFEASVKPEWVEALEYDHALLQREVGIPDLAFDRWIDDSYLRNAYATMDMDYDALVGTVVDTEPNNPDLKLPEIWFADRALSATTASLTCSPPKPVRMATLTPPTSTTTCPGSNCSAKPPIW